MSGKYVINSPKGFTLNAKAKFSPPDDEVEQDARAIFTILTHELQGKVTERALELYKIWDKYTDLPSTPSSHFNPSRFLEVLDQGKVDLDGIENY